MNSCLIRTQTVLKRIRKAYKFNIRHAVDLAHVIHGPPISSKPPFVVLHGFLGSKRNWATVSKKLSEVLNKTVIAADIRNHGESPHEASHTYADLAADVEQLMDKLNIEQTDLIGHSMGGRTAMLLALTKPFRVKNLIIVDISPVSTVGLINDFFPRLLDAMKSIKFNGTNVAEARLKAKRALAATGVVDAVETLGFVVMNAGMTINKSVGWTCNIDALRNNLNEIASFPQELVKGKQFSGRTLFIGGEDSHHLPPGDMKAIRQLFPKAEVHYMKGVGHNPHAEDLPSFMSVVVDFMNR